MRTVGIVCEYNPFHAGHKHQIDVLRSMGYDIIVCAMSGNYTQRGELAIADKYTRAEAAARCGADLVLELPFPFSSLSSEGFCAAGVSILSSVGCGAISFGSESADGERLRRAAEIISSEEFISAYSQAEKSSGSAKAYFKLLSDRLGGEPLLSNDILAISYMAAMKRLDTDMEAVLIKRQGAAYRDEILNSNLPSATAIRGFVKDSVGGFSALCEEHIPQASREVFMRAQDADLAPVFADFKGSDILSFFRLLSPKEIANRAILRSEGGKKVACDGFGIVERLCFSSKRTNDLSEMLNMAKTSKFTDARIQRTALFSLFGVSDIFEKSLPQYTSLLAASEAGRKYLSSIRKNAKINIITKPADAPSTQQTEILRLSDAFYASAMPGQVESDYFMKQHPKIL